MDLSRKIIMTTKKPNILFFVIDSLRADKCYGPKKTSITPNIDSLIQNGTYFEQAISSVASTAIAVSSILTAKLPFNIGMSGENFTKLSPDITNYVKILKDNGYHTYATAPEIASNFGLTYDFENKGSTYKNYFGLFAGLGEQIVNKLENKFLKKPWFFYIHLFDLHTPIIIPKKFEDKKFGESEYEKMVSFIDLWIGKILEKIRIDETLIVFTSDHGDYIPIIQDGKKTINMEPSSIEKTLWKIGNRIPSNLYSMKRKIGSIFLYLRQRTKSSKIKQGSLSPYEKRVLMNSRMITTGHRTFDDLIRIPLIFSGFSIPAKSNISQQIRHIDIFPTILDIIGLPQEKNTDGKSLSPLLHDESLEELPAYIESPPTIEGNSKKVIGIRTSDYKYVRDLDNSKEIIELYDLKNDPLEEKNIADDFPEIVKAMENKLNQIRNKKSEVTSTTSVEERKKIEAELRKLGYL